MVIKVLGSGCPNCNRLEATVRDAVARLGVQAEIVKVTAFEDIMGYGVMSTPALVVDEQVRIAGRIPTLDEVVSVLERAGS